MIVKNSIYAIFQIVMMSTALWDIFVKIIVIRGKRNVLTTICVKTRTVQNLIRNAGRFTES